MNFLEVFFGAFFTCYALFVLALIAGWFRTKRSWPSQNTALQQLPISVVIAIRNEARQLPALFESLNALQYPTDALEIVFVNDHSTDNSLVCLQDFKKATTQHTKILNLPHRITGKKAALALGITKAQHEIIATTDADCWLPANWLLSYAQFFQNPAIQFVAGAVVLKAPNPTAAMRFQQLEFLSLMGSGAAVIGWGAALMCNGANMAFRKTAYNAVGGHHRSAAFASGDDVFLLHHIKKQFPNSVAFLTQPTVYTAPCSTLQSFWQQRIRWASKAKGYQNPLAIGVSWMVFLAALLFLMAFVAASMNLIATNVLVLIFLLKTIPDYLFLKMLTRFYGVALSDFLWVAIVHPFYIVGVAVMAPFAKKTVWKGRTI